MLVVIHRRKRFVFPSPIHKYEDSSTLNSSFTRFAASVPKRTLTVKKQIVVGVLRTQFWSEYLDVSRLITWGGRNTTREMSINIIY